MLPWARGAFGQNFVQDNAPSHVLRETVAFLGQHDLEVMDCPAINLDMNPAGHVGDQISICNRDMDHPVSNLAECIKLPAKRGEQFSRAQLVAGVLPHAC